MGIDYDVHISFHYIRYIDKTGQLELDVELCLNESIIFIPSEEKWDSLFGDWAKGRRNEIVNKIKEKCKHLSDWKFEEY